MQLRISGNEWIQIQNQFTEREQDAISLAMTFNENLNGGVVEESLLHPYLAQKLRIAKLELN